MRNFLYSRKLSPLEKGDMGQNWVFIKSGHLTPGDQATKVMKLTNTKTLSTPIIISNAPLLDKYHGPLPKIIQPTHRFTLIEYPGYEILTITKKTPSDKETPRA